MTLNAMHRTSVTISLDVIIYCEIKIFYF